MSVNDKLKEAERTEHLFKNVGNSSVEASKNSAREFLKNQEKHSTQEHH